MRVHVAPYDRNWPLVFEDAKSSLSKILGGIPYTSITHVGSTSIPGLPAKPVLDIDIVIPLSALEATRQALVGAGYTDCGEMNVPGRFAFRQPGFGKSDAAFGSNPGSGEMRRNTYAMIEGCAALKNHLDVKKVLMEDDGLRGEYAELKWRLHGMEVESIREYAICKNEILVKILKKAGWSEEELEPVREANR